MLDQLYIVEPRLPDGTIDTKDENKCFTTFSSKGVRENELFNYYFEHNQNKKTATFKELKDFFATKNWYIREKNW